MQLQFDAQQEHQLLAIQSVLGLLDGQPRTGTSIQFSLGPTSFAAIPNHLHLTEQQILTNLQTIQTHNNIHPDTNLKTIQQPIQTANGPKTAAFYNFSIEMETGTGKTYVYIRTALELAARYGLRKYIIVVPSIAIREGVLKTFQTTHQHLTTLYPGQPYRYHSYDSANLSTIRQFALSDSTEFMIMTLAAFNKAANVIHQSTDRLQGETPIHLIQATRPILILDEPQNMESERSIAALSILDPLLALRYSATHRTPYNILYRLTPFEAYRQGLVKRIEVASVIEEDNQLQPYLHLHEITSQKHTLTARITIKKRSASGALADQTITIRANDDLQIKTARPEYQGYIVEEINLSGQFIRFRNNIEITTGQQIGSDQTALFEAQIRYTIEEHIRKQERLRSQGIKVLTLFFIDRVANYSSENGTPGPIQQLFNRIFNEIKTNHPTWAKIAPHRIQAAYFAQRKTRDQTILEDSSTGDAEKDKAVYDLIMKDKERLLSFEEPVCFIFSHSALREGWDNPNVFQICTLNQSTSEIKKRQEIGRGIRLSVNQNGQRIQNHRLNILTVIANQSYQHFVASLQSEIALEYQQEIEQRYGKPISNLSQAERAAIAQEYGKDILPPRPANARQKGTAQLSKEHILSPEFQNLWERIKHQTRYAVTINTEQLIQDILNDLENITVNPPRITITKVQLDAQDNAFEALQISSAKTVASLAGRLPLPNILEILSDLMRHTPPPCASPAPAWSKFCVAHPPKANKPCCSTPTNTPSPSSKASKPT